MTTYTVEIRYSKDDIQTVKCVSRVQHLAGENRVTLLTVSCDVQLTFNFDNVEGYMVYKDD